MWDVNVIGNIASVALVSGYGAFRLIKMMNGKKDTPSPPDTKCPDAGCQGDVKQNTKDLDEIKPVIHKTAIDVGVIRGYLMKEKEDE